MSSTPCIVLAGGLGTRLRSAVPDRPKCLAPVNSRTFLEIQLESLAARGIDHFVLSLGHQAAMVLASIGNIQQHCTVTTVTEETPLGTGGALLHVFNSLCLDEALVVNGDTYLDGNLSVMMPALRLADGEQLRIATVTVDDRQRYGGVRQDAGWLTGFFEKGVTGPGGINAGLYRLHRSAFDGFLPGTSFSLEADVMPRLKDRRAATVVSIDGEFIDIGVPDDYYRFCRTRG